MTGTAAAGSTTPHIRARSSHVLLSPVAVFGAAGVLFPAVGVYVLGRWLAAGRFRLRFGDGTPTSAGRLAMLVSLQCAVVLIAVVVVAWLVRQCRREGRFTFEAALCTGYASVFWMSPLQNFQDRKVLYNAMTVQVPSWGPQIPGWSSPGAAHQVEPIFGAGLGFLASVVYPLFTGILVRQSLLRRWPELRGVRLAVPVLLLAPLAELPLDILWGGSGDWAYARGLPALTLFSGHWYQQPVYLLVAMSVGWGGVPYLAWHHHARYGTEHSILRGSRHLPARLRGPAQALAPIGFINLCALSIMIVFWALGKIPGQLPAPGLPPHLV